MKGVLPSSPPTQTNCSINPTQTAILGVLIYQQPTKNRKDTPEGLLPQPQHARPGLPVRTNQAARVRAWSCSTCRHPGSR